MQINYYKEYSHSLGRDMEFKTYGRPGGKLCFAFPPQDGRFFDFENFGMVNELEPWINSGAIMLVTVDSIDPETWSDMGGDPRRRIERHEQWYHYVVDELFPRAVDLSGTYGRKALITGCSMGAVHSGNFFFRRPDLFDTLVGLSGLYTAKYFFGDYMDDLVYNNSPVHFLRNMPPDHFYMDLYRNSRIICCVGQGAWEEELLEGTRELQGVLDYKGIPAWIDYWGTDVSHDWYWWKRQIVYFFDKLNLFGSRDPFFDGGGI